MNKQKTNLRLAQREKARKIGRSYPKPPPDLFEPTLSENAAYIAQTRYAFRDENGKARHQLIDGLPLFLQQRSHVGALLATVRSKAIRQYVSPFLTVDLAKMADVFHTTVPLLEELRMLSNLETSKAKLVHFLLVGQ